MKIDEQALALLHQNRLSEAASLAGKVLAADAGSHLAAAVLGAALARMGRHTDACVAFDQALALRPHDADMLCNRGMAAAELGDLAGAEAFFRRSIDIAPTHARTLNNLANLLRSTNRKQEAAALYFQVLTVTPNHPLTHFNLGTALLEDGDPAGALAHLRQASAHNPLLAGNNLAIAMMRLGRAEDAAQLLARLAGWRGDHADSWANLGAALLELGRPAQALPILSRALHLDTSHHAAKSHKIQALANLCDWTATVDPAPSNVAAPPFIMLAREDDLASQAARSRAWAAQTMPLVAPRPTFAPGLPHRRLRIGYVAGDFHEHALLYLLSGVLRSHDREQVEIHVFSYGPVQESEMRTSAMDAVEHWHEVSGWSDAAIVELAREQRLDLAVDLKGFTAGSRTGLFAHGLAPIQVNWLGYPGTLGSPAFDWILADRTVLPEEDQPHYAERVWYLPQCYQPNDNLRRATGGGMRSDHDLPESAFVFCCFNNSFKIGPEEFSIWVDLLREVPGSVLWLLETYPETLVNLRRAAAARGVDPARLVFAPRVPHAEHLGRLVHADLFLDTFNYNAHTTASDALWMAVPVVTCPGRQFASRVGASLLQAVGLPQLIASNRNTYHAIASRLATNPDELCELRTVLLEARSSAPLFDTKKFTVNLESNFRRMTESMRCS